MAKGLKTFCSCNFLANPSKSMGNCFDCALYKTLKVKQKSFALKVFHFV